MPKAIPQTIDVAFDIDGKQENSYDLKTIKFDKTIDHVGNLSHFQSMEVGTFRDEIRVNDVGLYSFYQEPTASGTHLVFQYTDDNNPVNKHKYRLNGTLHFLK